MTQPADLIQQYGKMACVDQQTIDDVISVVEGLPAIFSKNSQCFATPCGLSLPSSERLSYASLQDVADYCEDLT
jgi:hypothetical protein